MKTIVFLGPSLSLDEATTLLPDAVYAPPARQGDLLSAVMTHKPEVVALIDGAFLQSQAVWHKEILFALNRGVAVYGASSIGALRAAETRAYGMVGVGRVFELFADGTLQDDDEVALSFGPAEDGYPALSYPLVNVRATLSKAVHLGLIEEDVANQIVSLTKDLYFLDRVRPRIVQRALDLGMAPTTTVTVDRVLREHYVDVKAADARQLLGILAAQVALPAAHSGDWLADSAGLSTLYNRERRLRVGDVDIPAVDIAEYVALHEPGIVELNEQALNRHLVSILGRLVGVVVAPESINHELALFQARHQLPDQRSLEEWLVTNHLELPELLDLMRQAAEARALHRWLIYARFTERTTKIVLDQLRLSGTYSEWSRKAAVQQRLLDLAGPDEVDALSGQPLAALAAEHHAYTGQKSRRDLPEWSELLGFVNSSDLKRAFAKASVARQTLLRKLIEAVSRVP